MKVIYLHVVRALIPWAVFCTFQCRAMHVKFKYFIVNAIKISLVLKYHIYFVHCSVAKLCPTLCSPMDCSTPASLFFTVSYSLSTESVMLFNHLILRHPFLLCLQSFPASGSFPVSWLFTSSGQSTGASPSVFPMNVQGWFPLGLTGLIALLSKGLKRVFSSTTIQKHQFFGGQLSLWSTLTFIHDYWKNHNSDYTALCRQSDVSAF